MASPAQLQIAHLGENLLRQGPVQGGRCGGTAEVQRCQWEMGGDEPGGPVPSGVPELLPAPGG